MASAAPPPVLASRRDYSKVASIIQAERNRILSTRTVIDPTIALAASTRRIAKDLADMFEADSATFDREHFLRACGL